MTNMKKVMEGLELEAQTISLADMYMGDITMVSIAHSLKRLADHFVPACGDQLSSFERNINDIIKDIQI